LNCTTTKEITDTGSRFVEDEKVRILKEIVAKTDAKVVLSSTWRMGWKFSSMSINDDFAKDFNQLRNKLLEFGIELYDRTVILSRFMNRRGDEIKMCLNGKKGIGGYVILDDLEPSYIEPCEKHLLQTDYRVGLQWSDVDKAVSILERKV